MALVLSALPIRFLSVLAIGVIAVWTYFAVTAGRSFDILTTKERDAGAQTSPADGAVAEA